MGRLDFRRGLRTVLTPQKKHFLAPIWSDIIGQITKSIVLQIKWRTEKQNNEQNNDNYF